MKNTSHVYKPSNYNPVRSFIGLIVIAVAGSIAINWGYWTDAWKIPVMIIVICLVGYVYVYKLWRIEITPQGQIFSRAGVTEDFRVGISSIKTLGKGTYYFPVAQPVLVITYTSEGKPNYTKIMPIVWGEKVIGQIIKDLLAINPSIQLDDYARDFLNNAA